MPAKNDFASRLQEVFRVRANSLFEKLKTVRGGRF